jgi:lysozyme
VSLNRKPIFDAVKRLRKKDFTSAEVLLLDRAIDEAEGVDKQPLPVLTVDKYDRNTGISDTIGSKKGPLVALVGAIAATTLLSTVPKEEGTEYKAYRDIAGIWTVCTGDTHNVHAGLIETPEGCRQRTETQLIIHAKGVIQCTPRLSESGRDYQLAAATSLAYNIGVGGYCKSSIDKRFDAGDMIGGCNAFLAWDKARVNGQLRVVQGLHSRRVRERAICLKGLT